MKDSEAKTLWSLTVALSFCLYLVSSGRAEALAETAKLVPAETIVLIDVGNFSELKLQFEKTNFYKLYKDPAMAQFVENLKKKVREKIRQKDNKIAEVIVNAEMLPEGRVSLAFIRNEQNSDPGATPFLFLSQWGQNIEQLKELTETEVRKAIESGTHRTTEDYRGVGIVTLIRERQPIEVPDLTGYDPKSGSPPPSKTVQPPPEKMHRSFVDDCLVVSNNVDVHKFAIAHMKGATGASLWDDADYVVGMKAAGPYHDLDLYINIKQIMKIALAKDATGKRGAMMASLGVDNVRSLACSIGVSRLAGSSFTSKAVVRIEGAKRGICKMLEAETTALRPPRFLPASASAALFYNLNTKKAYAELAKMLTSLSPQAAAIMYMPLIPPSPDGKPGLELKRDVIDHLGSQLVVTRSIKKPISVDSRAADTIFALAVDNREALEKSLSLLHSQMLAAGKPEAKRELLGYTIYLVELAGLMPSFLGGGREPMQEIAEPNAPEGPTLAFAVTDTHLLLGLESTVERAIRALSGTETTSIESAKWFRHAKSAIPSAVGLASLEDGVTTSELAWRTMKENAKSPSKNGSSTVAVGVGISEPAFPHFMFSQAGYELFDFALLPQFDAVRKYFGAPALYGVSRPDGFFFEFKYLNVPQGQ
ncbi:MAG: hypothetical protein ACYTEL_08890 [Planctomycetota bacterium]